MLFAFLAAAVALQPAARSAPAIPEGEALRSAIVERSADFFTVFQDLCDPERLRSILLPSFEMYHDQNGVLATSAEPFVARYAARCRSRLTPGGPRLRRQLLHGSQRINPVPGYGAIEEGIHEMFGRLANRPERKVTTARYFHLWTLTPDGWRLARSFSYDHRDEPRLPPIPPR